MTKTPKSPSQKPNVKTAWPHPRTRSPWVCAACRHQQATDAVEFQHAADDLIAAARAKQAGQSAPTDPVTATISVDKNKNRWVVTAVEYDARGNKVREREPAMFRDKFDALEHAKTLRFAYKVDGVAPSLVCADRLEDEPAPTPVADPKGYVIPSTPVAAPIARLVKRRDGVIGHPWVEILSIAPGSPDNFHRGTHYFCRFPNPISPDMDDCLGWFTDRDLFGDGGDPGEYDPLPG